jgi:hypothetical protein
MAQIADIVDVVNTLQGEIFESSGKIEYFNLVVSTDGFSTTIAFCGIVIWSSEADEDIDDVKAFEMALRYRIRTELQRLSRIKV